MYMDTSKSISPRERLSYELILLRNILDCSRLRWSGDAADYMTCVDTLMNLLIRPLREEVKRIVKSDGEYRELYDRIRLLQAINKSNLQDFEEIGKLKKMARDLGFNDILSRLEGYEKELRRALEQEGYTRTYNRRNLLEVLDLTKDRLFKFSRLLSDYDLDSNSIEENIRIYRSQCVDIIFRTIIDVLDKHGLLLKYDNLRIGVPSANTSGSNKEGL